jgi:uncharacterized membrane protein YbaN (DUF454 family)
VHPFCLDIEIDEDAGSVRVYDPRAFHAGRRAFCRRLLEAVARQPGIDKAEIDLASATCRIEFGLGSATSRSMATAFVDSVREATAGSADAGWKPWWRPTRGWSTLTAYRHAGDIVFWETLEAKPGRIRLRHPGISVDRARLSRLADTLAGLEGVERCRVSPWFRTITIAFRPEGPVANRLLDQVERTWEDVLAAGPILHRSPDRATNQVDGDLAQVATGLNRLKYFALAGGSAAMTLAGLVVPGIPTVPFLLATSYYLARSSPRLNERLRRTMFFGPILNEWEYHHGLSWSSKGKLMGLTGTIIVVTVALTPLSPIALVLILLASSLTIYGVARLPVLSGEARGAIRLERPARIALPTP